eukprot:TRINITY_DN29269_c0_g1_i1.p2 TRINITY_DN29269_c0_g1~~TRINITY_DN29269_c0_g1_i1.p2  ORF type:complete len:170 (+),score=1.78 TRINITY_DN29269_c0_g1_i1:12-521(+)
MPEGSLCGIGPRARPSAGAGHTSQRAPHYSMAAFEAAVPGHTAWPSQHKYKGSGAQHPGGSRHLDAKTSRPLSATTNCAAYGDPPKTHRPDDGVQVLVRVMNGLVLDGPVSSVRAAVGAGPSFTACHAGTRHPVMGVLSRPVVLPISCVPASASTSASGATQLGQQVAG